MIRSFGSYFWLVVGALVAALGIDGFLLPNHFIDGGVTGISMLLAQWGDGVERSRWLHQSRTKCVVLRGHPARTQPAGRVDTHQDDTAFVVISPVHEVSGGTLKRRVFH